MLTQLTHDIATPLSRRRWLAATAGLVLGLATFTSARAADDTIKVGVLHSLSGTMAISETTLKDTVLFMIDEQNKKGGVLGKKLEAVVVDPASNWPLFAEKARELITKDKVAVVFGCWTSVSRKSVLPVFKELNSILFYPVQYEGEESERNVFSTGAAPNQQVGAAAKKAPVVSTINCHPNVPFYKELGNQGIKATDIPVVAFSVGEEELAGIDTKPLLGHLAAWNYFESVDTKENKAFIKEWHTFTKKPTRTTNDPMEAHYIGFNMWVKAVEKAGTTDPDKVIAALPGIEQKNLTGGTAKMLPNHHITKPVFIGEIRADGQFDVVWQTKGLVPGAPWSPYLPESKDLTADWVKLKCGNYNTVTKTCGGST